MPTKIDSITQFEEYHNPLYIVILRQLFYLESHTESESECGLSLEDSMALQDSKIPSATLNLFTQQKQIVYNKTFYLFIYCSNVKHFFVYS